MFDIGFSELLIVAIVALIVLGPERLPKATRFAGLWVRRARAQWHSVKDELERELAAEELKRGFQDAKDAFRETEQRVRESGEEVKRDFDALRDAVESDPERRPELDEPPLPADAAEAPPRHRAGEDPEALPPPEDAASPQAADEGSKPKDGSDEPRNV